MPELAGTRNAPLNYALNLTLNRACANIQPIWSPLIYAQKQPLYTPANTALRTNQE
jgi:hypothetical protein